MKHRIFAGFITISSPILLGLSLQSCGSTVVKHRSNTNATSLPRLSDADTSKLFQKGVRIYLNEISKGRRTFSKKPVKVFKNPLIRKVVLSTNRGKELTNCQFLALRIEVDSKKATSDWLVTTKGKGRCSGHEQYFWIIQQEKAEQAKVLLASRGSYINVHKVKNSAWSELKVDNSTDIKIKSGDKLANGDWIQVLSKDKGLVEISCNAKFRIQNSRYQLYSESSEASVNSAMSHGKSWQPVNDPRYRCPF